MLFYCILGAIRCVILHFYNFVLPLAYFYLTRFPLFYKGVLPVLPFLPITQVIRENIFFVFLFIGCVVGKKCKNVRQVSKTRAKWRFRCKNLVRFSPFYVRQLIFSIRFGHFSSRRNFLFLGEFAFGGNICPANLFVKIPFRPTLF